MQITNPEISLNDVAPTEFALTSPERRLAQFILQYGMAVKNKEADSITPELGQMFLSWCDNIRISSRNVLLMLEGKVLPYVDNDGIIQFYTLSDKVMAEWQKHLADTMSKFEFLSQEEIE